ncbi:DciA family protein [Collinsella provencensis]|uniref:DciA family protein n=1 Tax=Collinsella provencensis TaxID=1937461 RepID=UPI000C820AEB|nr:DciA family protein [Collinsella provencensis]
MERKSDKSERARATVGLGEFLSAERSRIFDGASEDRREQYRQAERRGEVFRAWNTVCANTREGKHVTGLHFVPERNELIVYTDGASWTQELTMLREIIRARMERVGASVDNIVVKTTRPGFHK